MISPTAAKRAAEIHAAESSESDTDSLNVEDEEEWDDAEPDEESLPVVSLFSDEVFPSAAKMIEDCKQRYGFDFVGIQKQLGLDFYSNIKLVNYIRSEVRDGNLSPNVSSKELFQDDKFLQPVLQDDALLTQLDDLTNFEQEGLDEVSAGEESTARSGGQDAFARIAELEQQLHLLQSQFADYRLMVQRTLDDRWNDGGEEGGSGPSMNGSLALNGARPPKDTRNDQGYFDSYSYNDIHAIMLKDTVRTDAYRDFIYDNKHLFKGKVVLDVGCGTGILSMFCARAGAARVIAVDNSSIIDKARENVFANNLADKITCLRGKIEEVTLPVPQVDIIVSEWMGYCLLFEAMLDSVLWARDRYLRPDGLMVPSHCTLHIAPITDSDYITENVEFWRDVYSFDMSSMLKNIHDDVLVRQLSPSNIAARSSIFMQLPLHEITVEDLTFQKGFSVDLDHNIEALDGWVIWFDTFFLASRSASLPGDARAEDWKGAGHDGVAFTTGPAGRETHWRSGVMLIERNKQQPAPLKKDQKILGTVDFKKGKENARALEVQVEWRSEDGREKGEQSWHML